MENKFKVGDKVKNIKNMSNLKSGNRYVGLIGIIVDIDNDSLPYLVKFKNGKVEWFEDDELELVEEDNKERKNMKRKFKLGDRVNNFRFGDGTIIGIDIDNTDQPYLVEFDKEDSVLHGGSDLLGVKYGKSTGTNYHCWWCYDNMITLISKDDTKKVKSNTEDKKEEYVTKAEFEEFKKSINKSIEKTEYKKETGRVENDEEYWYIDDYGEICSSYECFMTADDYRYKTGNYYLTEKECKRAKEIQAILLKYSYKFSLEELLNNNVSKYEIYVDIDDKILGVNEFICCISAEPLFKTTEDCQKALDEIGYEDFIKYCVRGNIK